MSDAVIRGAGKAAKVKKNVKVCSYGARLLGGDDATQKALYAMRGQNRLWNALVEIENRSRAAYQSNLQASDPELDGLTKQADAEQLLIDALFEARNKERSKERTKKGDKAQSYAELIKSAKAKLAAIRKQMKDCKVRAKEAAKPLLDAAEKERRAAVAEAGRKSGLWWAHSEMVLAKFDVARIRAMKEGANLKFHRFTGEGSMGVRFSVDGGSLDKIWAGKTTLLLLRAPTPQELGRASAVKADGGRRVIARVRAGDKDDENNIPFLEFLVTMHAGMELPEDMPLKTVTITRRVHVNKAEWGMTFTFSKEADASAVLPDLPKSAAGVDFGFRVIADGNQKCLRVGAVSLGDRVQYINLNEDWMRRMDRADRLRGELADSANTFSAEILEMIADVGLDELADDDWFKVLAQKARRAKAAYPNLFMDLCQAHTRAGLPLGQQVEDKMQAWYQHALRLALQAHHCKRKAVDHRKHVYRNAAAKLVASAGLIGLEDTDFRKIAKLEKADGSDTELVQTARKYRTWAAPSELRLAIEQAAKREKRELVMVDPANTTRTCSHCGHVHAHAIEDLTFVCGSCSKVWDQDENAAHNIRKMAMNHEKIELESMP